MVEPVVMGDEGSQALQLDHCLLGGKLVDRSRGKGVICRRFFLGHWGCELLRRTGLRSIHTYSRCSNGYVGSAEHTSALQSLMRLSYAVFCLHTKIRQQQQI